MATIGTLELKIVGVGNSKLGIFLLKIVAKLIKINLKVV